MELTLNARPVSAVQDDSRLVAAARQGDDRAFEQLYARYRERIYAFILSKVRDHGRAEDIAQDVFMSALRQMRCTDQDLAFKPWLYTIARNACIDEFRRGSRAAEVPVESEEDLDASAAQGPFVTAVPTPDSAVESKQNLDDLRGAFEGLTESQHQLLVLREFEGRSYDEIGDRLGMTKQMVESGLFRARRKLSEEYDELASGRRCEQIQTAIDAGTLRVAKGMGIRDRRRYARHLAHCQPCRHVARMTGVDDTLLKPRRLVDKVAVRRPPAPRSGPVRQRRSPRSPSPARAVACWPPTRSPIITTPPRPSIAPARRVPRPGRRSASSIARRFLPRVTRFRLPRPRIAPCATR
jgi:RNA polymerase sigma factor (sigma-70 family)